MKSMRTMRTKEAQRPPLQTALLLHRYLLRVQFPMQGESPTPAEGFPAHLTLIRFLASVNSLVLDEGDFLTEGLPALLTFERFLPCVNALVLSQGRGGT